MAHYYVVRQKLDKTGAEDKVRYYGVPVTCGRVSTKKLADLVADRCSLSRGDVFASVCEIGGMILELWVIFIFRQGAKASKIRKNVLPIG